MHIVIVGQVQGVGFRHWTKRTAERLGLSGWVQNLEDGSVEILCEGEESTVTELITLAGKGPTSAVVRGLLDTRQTYRGEFSGFDIKR